MLFLDQPAYCVTWAEAPANPSIMMNQLFTTVNSNRVIPK